MTTTIDPTVTEPPAEQTSEQEPKLLTVARSIVAGTQRVDATGGTTPDGRTKFRIVLELSSDNPDDDTNATELDLTDDQRHRLTHLSAMASLMAAEMDALVEAFKVEQGLDCLLTKLFVSGHGTAMFALDRFMSFSHTEKWAFMNAIAMGRDPMDAIVDVIEHRSTDGNPLGTSGMMPRTVQSDTGDAHTGFYL